MTVNKSIYRFLTKVAQEPRLCTGHIGLYAALAFLGKDHPAGEFFPITRKQLMRHAAIHSPATYHKRLSELVRYGYILYRPSYDPFRGSQAALTMK
jgi:hypothetical protein